MEGLLCLCVLVFVLVITLLLLVAAMPATAFCSLIRSLPGPWPGQYNFVQFMMLFCLGVT